MKRPLYLFIVLTTLAALLLSACSTSNTNEPLVVLIETDEGTLTPLGYRTATGFWMTGWVYDTLYARDLDFNPVPSLATNATPNQDGSMWTITLRQNVKWHDGEPFTSEDVLFTYQFLVQANRLEALSLVDKVEARGDYVVDVTLRQPSPFFLSEALTTAYILPAHIWQGQVPNDPQLGQFQATVGTGAYKLTSVAPGESYTFEANREYFRGIPRVASMIVKVVPSRAQQADELRKRTAGASLAAMDPTQADQLERVRRIDLAEGANALSYILYANGSRTPFDQDAVREAISLAIDYEALVKNVLLGRGKILPSSYYHSDLPWAVGAMPLYDPDAAKTLLEFAGLQDSDGDGVREWQGQPMDYAVLCNSDRPLEVQTTDLIVQWLQDIGIEAHANCVDTSTQLSMMWPNYRAISNPDYDLALFSWPGDVQTQRSFLRYMVSDPNKMGWANLSGVTDPQLEQLIASYLIEGDPTQQEALGMAIQEQFSEVLPMIPLMAPNGTYAYLPEKYAGWQYMKGIGIGTFWSFLQVQPATQ